MFNLPDISRVDIVAILTKFPDRERERERAKLLKEIARGFQDSHHKAQWAHGEDEICPFCHQQDTYYHRLYTCAAFTETRQEFEALVDASFEHGTFDEQLAVTVHSQSLLCRTLHYKEPWPTLPHKQHRPHPCISLQMDLVQHPPILQPGMRHTPV